MLCISTELGIVGSRYSLHSLMGRKLQLTHGLHKTSLKLRSNKREINSSCKTKLDCLVMICLPALSPLSSWGDLLFRGLYLDIYRSVKRLATLNNRKTNPRLNNDAGSHNQKSRQYRLQVQCDQGSGPIFLAVLSAPFSFTCRFCSQADIPQGHKMAASRKWAIFNTEEWDWLSITTAQIKGSTFLKALSNSYLISQHRGTFPFVNHLLARGRITMSSLP